MRTNGKWKQDVSEIATLMYHDVQARVMAPRPQPGTQKNTTIFLIVANPIGKALIKRL